MRRIRHLDQRRNRDILDRFGCTYFLRENCLWISKFRVTNPWEFEESLLQEILASSLILFSAQKSWARAELEVKNTLHQDLYRCCTVELGLQNSSNSQSTWSSIGHRQNVWILFRSMCIHIGSCFSSGKMTQVVAWMIMQLNENFDFVAKNVFKVLFRFLQNPQRSHNPMTRTSFNEQRTLETCTSNFVLDSEFRI